MDAETLYQTRNAAYLGRVKRQFNRALTLSLSWIAMLLAVFLMQDRLFDTRALAIEPQKTEGLIGILSAPMLHGSFEHLASNAFAILILGTLAGSLFPRASRAALPVVWIVSGIGTWFISLGGHHIGASGVTVGLMFFLIAQGLRRRDRMSLAGLMLALFFFGGMVLSVLPQEAGVSWEYHLSGALVGFVCGLLFAGWDELAPERLYSWDLEPEAGDADAELQLPKAQEVPVLWQRPEPRGGDKVLPFPRPDS
jgi:membrane associated rhomboid family serine protease